MAFNTSITPPPYPVMIILAIVSVFLGASWYTSFESAKETAGEHLNWLLLATPVTLIFIARLASKVEYPEEWIFGTPLDRRMRSHGSRAEDGNGGGGGGGDGGGDWGTSPWGVGGAILIVIVLVLFQSSFHDAWFG